MVSEVDKLKAQYEDVRHRYEQRQTEYIIALDDFNREWSTHMGEIEHLSNQMISLDRQILEAAFPQEKPTCQ